MHLVKAFKKDEKSFQAIISDLFPSHNIIHNAKKAAHLMDSATGRYLEIDVYIPELNLGFEYQVSVIFQIISFSHNQTLYTTLLHA
jgi:hypothetical protein